MRLFWAFFCTLYLSLVVSAPRTAHEPPQHLHSAGESARRLQLPAAPCSPLPSSCTHLAADVQLQLCTQGFTVMLKYTQLLSFYKMDRPADPRCGPELK